MSFKTLLLLILLVLPAGWFLFGPGYYIMHDDLQVMRILEIEKCLNDGQIPCRWAPDMAYGYGQAMFNFYSAFPYYLGVLVRILTPLSIMASVKFTFFLSIFASGVGMYLLAKEFWGKLGGFLSAALYVYAPYHALDIYVRGALAESWALALFPWLWFSYYKLIKEPDLKWTLLSTINFAALLTTHNISTLIFSTVTIFWVSFWLLKFRNLRNIKYIFLSGIIGIGLSSFFTFPALYEQRLIQIEHLTGGYSDYHAHFVSLSQLFLDRKWGDGPSIWGTEDNISFQVGWPHWWLGIIVFLAAISKLIKKRKDMKAYLITFLIFLFLASSYLTHFRSLPLWEKLPLIPIVQFPWRFLGLSIFFLSFAGGALSWFEFKFKKTVVLAFIFMIFVFNISYFKPVHFSRKVRDEEKLVGVAWELQQKAAILDYLPKTAEIAPPAPAFDKPDILEGNGFIENYSFSSNRFSFEAEMYNEGQVVVPVMYFPNWTALLDGKAIPIEIHGAHGLIKVKVPEGRHVIRGRFANTPVRTLGNTLSIISLSILLFGLVKISVKEKKI